MQLKYLKRFALKAMALAAGVGIFAADRAEAAFGLTTSTDFYTVDTGAGLVFKVRRTDNGSSTQSPGDIASLVWNGVEFQDQSRGSQINSGFDYLYSGISAVTVSAAVINTDYIKITVQAGNLTHYYMARNGYPNIYMATYFTTEPNTLGLCRYILRMQSSVLPNGPTPSDIQNNTGAIESSDIFGMADGTTRSKHYSNHRLIDWSYIGATGSNVGIWVVRDNNEGNSGGPFFRCLLNQCGSDQEITYIVNYGEAQTEAYRTNILNSYTMVCTTGGAPGTSIDTSWFANMGLTGYVAPSGRGKVAGVGISGRDTNYTYTVGFANTHAEYWATARASDGYFSCGGMIPGTYTMTVYKNELSVYTGSVTVTAGGTTALNTIPITADPSSTATIWRIGNWDGTPNEFLNADKMTYMHPSDVRMSNWGPVSFTIGQSSTGSLPAVQFRGTNSPTTIHFSLTSAQAGAAHTIKIGITTAYNNGRPQVTINGHTLSNPSASSQPGTRTITIGSYRGNNTTFSWSIPSGDFISGSNTMTITPISGNADSGPWLSASYTYDCIELDN